MIGKGLVAAVSLFLVFNAHSNELTSFERSVVTSVLENGKIPDLQKLGAKDGWTLSSVAQVKNECELGVIRETLASYLAKSAEKKGRKIPFPLDDESEMRYMNNLLMKGIKGKADGETFSNILFSPSSRCSCIAENLVTMYSFAEFTKFSETTGFPKSFGISNQEKCGM